MPKISPEAQEQSIQRYEEMLVNYMKEAGHNVGLSFTGVGRKVNIGNYENIDVYYGLLLPVLVAEEHGETLESTAHAAATIGFNIASEVTGERYMKIKERAKG